MGAGKGMLYRLRGYALMRQGEWKTASACIDESLRLARSISAQYEVALSLQALASLAHATGDDPAPYLDECVPILERLGVTSMSRLEQARPSAPARARCVSVHRAPLAGERPRRPPAAEPRRQAPGPPPGEALPLEVGQPRVGRAGALRAAEGHAARDRAVAIEPEHLPALPHVVEIPRELVLQLGDVGPLHMAIIAITAGTAHLATGWSGPGRPEGRRYGASAGWGGGSISVGHSTT